MTTRRSSKSTPVSLLLLRSREVGAAEFKARCLEIMDEVDRLGIEVTITKHRRPVARLVPAARSTAGFCGSLKDLIVEHGDLVGSVDVPWEADERNIT